MVLSSCSLYIQNERTVVTCYIGRDASTTDFSTATIISVVQHSLGWNKHCYPSLPKFSYHHDHIGLPKLMHIYLDKEAILTMSYHMLLCTLKALDHSVPKVLPGKINRTTVMLKGS